jgi:hypothetical protein
VDIINGFHFGGTVRRSSISRFGLYIPREASAPDISEIPPCRSSSDSYLYRLYQKKRTGQVERAAAAGLAAVSVALGA